MIKVNFGIFNNIKNKIKRIKLHVMASESLCFLGRWKRQYDQAVGDEHIENKRIDDPKSKTHDRAVFFVIVD